MAQIKRLLGKLLLFGFVGAATLIFGNVCLYLSIEKFGINPTSSFFISAIMQIGFSFLFNSRLTFRSQVTLAGFSRLVIVTSLSAVVSALMSVLIFKFLFEHKYAFVAYNLPPLLLVIPNFYVQQWLVYATPEKKHKSRL